MELRGKAKNQAGTAKDGLTVELWKIGEGGPIDTTATDADGMWEFLDIDPTEVWEVAVIDGLKVQWVSGLNSMQLNELTVYDTLNTDTIAEKTPDAGVTVDGVLCKDGKIPLSALPEEATFVLNVAASDDLRLANAAERTGTGIGWTIYSKLKESKVGAGALRIEFDLKKTGANGALAYGKIYRNGVAVGTERSVATGGGYPTFSEDISGWAIGDLCQIYGKLDNYYDTVYVKALSIYGAPVSVWSAIT